LYTFAKINHLDGKSFSELNIRMHEAEGCDPPVFAAKPASNHGLAEGAAFCTSLSCRQIVAMVDDARLFVSHVLLS